MSKNRFLSALLASFILLAFLAGAFPGYSQTFTKHLIGKEDIFWSGGGTGAVETFTATGSDARTYTFSKVDATYLKFRAAAIAGSVEDFALALTNGIYSYTLKLKEIILKGPEVDARAYGSAGQATIIAALADIGSKQKTLVLYPNLTDTTTTWSIAADQVIPSTVSLKVGRGAIVSIATTKTLTINGPLNAGLYQILSGTGNTVFGPGSVNEVFPEWWATNAAPGVTDMSAAIQAADDAVSGAGAYFPVANVRFQYTEYLLGTTINKSPFTGWLGSGCRGVNVPHGKGTRLVNGQTGIMVSIISAGVVYVGYSGRMENMALYSDIATYPSATAVYIENPRQIIFKNLYVYGFNAGFTGTGGEFYFERVYSVCKYAANFASALADSWFNECHFGASISGAIGFQASGATNLSFAGCRFQECTAGYGGYFRSCRGMQFTNCIADSNGLRGLQFIACTNVNISNVRAYENGTIAAKGRGIEWSAESYTISSTDATANTVTLSSTSAFYTGSPVRFTGADLPDPLVIDRDYWLIRQAGSFTVYKVANSYTDAIAATAIDIIDAGSGAQVCLAVARNLVVTGGVIEDRNYPITAAVVQDKGITISKNTGYVSDITITGVDLSRNATPIEMVSTVDANFRVSNCNGVASVTADVGNAGIALTEISPEIQRWNTTLTAERSCSLPATGNYDGKRIKILRTAAATGAFNLLVKNIATSTLKTIAASGTGDWADFVFSGSLQDWVVISSGTL